MIKKSSIFGIVAFLAVTCHALPQGYTEERPEVELVYSRTGTFVGTELPNGEHLPEDCTFISKSETIEGGIKEGEYSYLDPVGSLVIVKYSVGIDGEGYTEKRRIVKNQGSNKGSSQVTTASPISSTGSVNGQTVVSKIILELKPSIISIIRATVQASNLDNLDSDNLVKTIIIQLRPVVFAAAENALSSSTASGLNPGDLTDQILLEITPFVEEGVRIEIKEQAEQIKATISVDQFVSTIITDLRPTVIRIISASVASANVDLTNYQNLVEEIIVRLRPVILSSVQTALTGSTVAGNFNAEDLTERIILQLRPFVEEGVKREVVQIQQQQRPAPQPQRPVVPQPQRPAPQPTAVSEKKIVQTVISQLRPTVIRIIRVSVESSNVDLSNYKNLVEEIITKLRPVVLSAVRDAIAGSGSYNAEDLTEQIILELRPFVEEGVQKEVIQIQEQSQVPALTEEQVVRTVISQLRPTVIRIITETVSSSNVNLDNSDQLVETILVQLRPVVISAVQNALSSSPSASSLNANNLSEKITLELRPFIQEGVRKEIVQVQQQQQQQVAPTGSKTADQVVNTVIVQLRPTVITIIREAVSSSNLDSGNYDGLVETIIVQLRPVVLNAVQAAISSSGANGNYNAEDLAQRIILELRPFIQEGVQREVTQQQQQRPQLTEDQVVATVISQLRPTIIRIIQETVRLSSNVNLNNPSGLIETIVVQLRPVVQQSVRTAISTSSSQFNPDDLSEKILIQIRPFVKEGVEQQITEISSTQQEVGRLTEEDVVRTVITQLRPTIISIIQKTVTLDSNVNLNNPDNLIETIVVQLRPVVLQSVKAAIATSTTSNHFNAEDLSEKIIIELRPFVREGVIQQITKVTAYQQVELTEDEVVSTVIGQLRPTIITVIRATVESQGTNNLNNPDGLVQTIIFELRPVVLKSVENALESSSANFDANKLSERILSELTPFVQEGVQKELISKVRSNQVKETTITSSGSQNSSPGQGDLVTTIVSKLRPVIVKTVQTAYENNNVVATPAIVQEVVPRVEVTENGDEGALVNDIIIKLTPVIQRTVSSTIVQRPQQVVAIDQEEGAGYSIETVNTDQETTSTITLTPEQEQIIISHAVITLTPSVKTATRTKVTKEFQSSSGDDEDLIESIIDQLRVLITETLQKELKDESYDTDVFGTILEKVVLKLRSIIIQEIRIIRAEFQQQQEEELTVYGVPLQEPLQPIQQQQPQQQQTNEVKTTSSIFGISGKNTVRVESTNYNYKYESEK